MSIQPISGPLPPYEYKPTWVSLMAPAARLAEAVSRTEFVPKGLRGNPSAIAAAILLGEELGLGPMTALNNLDVVDGSVQPSAELMRALVLREGHELNVVESTNTRCVLAGRRHGSSEWTTVTWSMDDAQRAGLAGRGPWKSYPRVMLQARATTELCRLIFADVVSGLPAEVVDLVDADDTPVAPAKPTRALKRKTAIEPPQVAALEGADTTATDSVETVPLPPAEDTTVMRTDSQSRKVFALLKSIGWDKREDGLTLISAIVGRDIPSSSVLTKAEASTVIEWLTEAEANEDRDTVIAKRVIEWETAVAEIVNDLDDNVDDIRGD